tara:strand:- start:2349 stop:3263 length:915 start_codon:yes stop_codon:yes gene_type:complete
MTNDLLSLLSSVIGSSGRKLRKQNEYMFWSPFIQHHKPKLQINVETGKWHCWVSNEGGHKFYQLFRKLNATPEQFKELSLLTDTFYIEKEDTKSQVITLPEEFKSLYEKSTSIVHKHALTYLYDRGITDSDILKYNIGYCDDGLYNGRIIIPSYDENFKLNYFIARAFYPSYMKYKNPPVSKDIIAFDNMINWDLPIVLCEGVFDAIAIKRNCIPLLGKTIPKKLLKKIIEKKVSKVIISLDTDAKNEIFKISDIFKKYNIDVYIVNLKEKDPSEEGFKNMISLIKGSKVIDLKNQILMRLKEI